MENTEEITELFPSTSIREHTNSIDALAVHPSKDGWFATGSHDRTIKLWDASKESPNATFDSDDKGIWCLDYCPDGAQIASACSSGICKLWDPRTKKATSKLDAHKGFAFWVRYSHDGSQVLTCGIDRKIHLWDTKKTKKPLATFEQKGVTRCVEFLDGDSKILSSSLDGDIMIHDKESGDLIHERKVLGDKPEKEGNTCYCVRALKDSAHFLSTHEDLLVR